MAGDINVFLEKLPESPIFWLIVAIIIDVGLFASGKIATAFLFLALSIGVICLISNLESGGSNSTLWIVFAVCLFVVVLTALFVSSEWNTPTPKALPPSAPTQIIPTPSPSK